MEQVRRPSLFVHTRISALAILLCLFLLACWPAPALPSRPAVPVSVVPPGVSTSGPVLAATDSAAGLAEAGVKANDLSSSAAGPPGRCAAFTGRPAGLSAGAFASAPIYSYHVVNTYPHDPGAFTEGLVYTDSVLYESTGLVGQSSLRRVDLETGEVLQIRPVPGVFGEGIAVYSDTIVQLTYTEQKAFVYDRVTFSQTGIFSYTGQGWGLTHDGQRLIMSDGSSTLYFRDPLTFSETGRVQVQDDGTPVTRLNELEYIGGEVYANVWLTDRIVVVDPQTGRVTAWINLAGLRPPGTNELNGIAYDTLNGRLFVTGKNWPYLYEIEPYLPRRVFLPLVFKNLAGSPPPTPIAVPGE